MPRLLKAIIVPRRDPSDRKPPSLHPALHKAVSLVELSMLAKSTNICQPARSPPRPASKGNQISGMKSAAQCASTNMLKRGWQRRCVGHRWYQWGEETRLTRLQATCDRRLYYGHGGTVAQWLQQVRQQGWPTGISISNLAGGFIHNYFGAGGWVERWPCASFLIVPSNRVVKTWKMDWTRVMRGSTA